MASPAANPKKIPVIPVAIAALATIVVVAAVSYLSRPAPKAPPAPASPEAKQYVNNLQLSNVDMKASENFMKQQVVEITGKIANNGSRPINSVDVYCLFYGLNGSQIYSEKVPIVQSKGKPFEPGETRSFRLPFDSLPEGWNEATPRMIIAQITFAK